MLEISNHSGLTGPDDTGGVRLPHLGRFWKSVVAFALLGLYVFGQPWSERGYVSDVEAATLPAWHFVETGSFEMSEFKDLNPWFVETDSGVWSMRTPGIIGSAVVAYAVTQPLTDGFENWPGIAMAVLVSWMAVLIVAAVAERMRPGVWLLAVVLFGLGTATWGVSAGQLNPHGSSQLAIAAGLWFLVARKDVPSGLAFGIAVLIRPPVLILGAGLGLSKALWDRSLRPLFTIALPSVLAGALYLAYNRILFSSWNPTAAYEAVGGFLLADNRLGNILGAFFSLSHGLLIWSSWLVLGLAFLAIRRRDLPRGVWMVPLVAALYVVFHSYLEIAGGGLPYNYRYALEPVTFAAPLLLVLVPESFRSRIGRVAFVVTSALSLVLQSMFVLTGICGVYPSDPMQVVCSLVG